LTISSFPRRCCVERDGAVETLVLDPHRIDVCADVDAPLDAGRRDLPLGNEVGDGAIARILRRAIGRTIDDLHTLGTLVGEDDVGSKRRPEAERAVGRMGGRGKKRGAADGAGDESKSRDERTHDHPGTIPWEL
jgi:hypothetical protein